MSIRSSGIFTTVPQSFFSPLASPNRVHYAALLIRYYRLFQESPHGIERKILINRFAEYFDAHREQFEAETDSEEDTYTPDDEVIVDTSRYLAAKCVRLFIHTGWISEETLSDYTRVINMSAHARPFLDALARIDEGISVEYESHVVSIYSLLCGDAARENGHYLVLNAHAQTIALIDSLKVLSQSIREHYERLMNESEGLDIAGILSLHYDAYALDVLDGAYKRLKTSDNLSRYRPKILAQVRDFLADEAWLSESAVKFSRTSSLPVSEARERLLVMLEEIKDILKAVDPLLEEIDRRNMLYAKSSVERVKVLLESESTISGKIVRIITSLYETPYVYQTLSHHLYRVRAITPESRYRRWLRETINLEYVESPTIDPAEFDRMEAEFTLRLARQLTPAKIERWLDEKGGKEKILSAKSLADTSEGFVRLLYAVLFADSQPETFAYQVEESQDAGEVTTASGWIIPEISLRRNT